jgi:hypothetical protein
MRALLAIHFDSDSISGMTNTRCKIEAGKKAIKSNHRTVFHGKTPAQNKNLPTL